jgi:peptidoglycan/xylan/chitin deacetylase (PgdA/CDA1 family)
MNGTLIISLDFELHWGGFEKWPLEKYTRYFLNTREVIPRMLDLFARHNIHVTWASVGMLMHNSLSEAKSNYPVNKPTYDNKALSAYNYIETTGIGLGEQDDPFHYAPSLIKRIIATPNQELGTHTFAHFYCNEPGNTYDQFQEDLRAASRAARLHEQKLNSLVFPRNQFNDRYLKICWDEGIIAVRSNPKDWFWKIDSTQHESFWLRLNRGLDAYYPVGQDNSYTLDEVKVTRGIPVCLPASRLLRPYMRKETVLRNAKLNRIRHELTSAAKRSAVYHLWWHPHNFGWYPEENLHDLERILEFFSAMRDAYGMQSLSMQEVAHRILTHAGTKAA